MDRTAGCHFKKIQRLRYRIADITVRKREMDARWKRYSHYHELVLDRAGSSELE